MQPVFAPRAAKPVCKSRVNPRPNTRCDPRNPRPVHPVVIRVIRVPSIRCDPRDPRPVNPVMIRMIRVPLIPL